MASEVIGVNNMTRTANYIRATIVLTMGLLTAYGILPLIMRVMQ